MHEKWFVSLDLLLDCRPVGGATLFECDGLILIGVRLSPFLDLLHDGRLEAVLLLGFFLSGSLTECLELSLNDCNLPFELSYLLRLFVKVCLLLLSDGPLPPDLLLGSVCCQSLLLP